MSNSHASDPSPVRSPRRHGMSVRSQYRILGMVGHGQFGRVFFGIHRKTGYLFALKELDHDRFPTHQFLREMRFLVMLQHPNIVTCWACEYVDSHRYLVTDYCEGGTLRQLMDRLGALPVAQGLELVANILEGLEHAHAQGIIHCDIKPENILLNLQGDRLIPRIADFGIARLAQQEMSKVSSGMSGSPAYMAPERFYGQHSVSADLYAVGVLLYELLLGERPFTGTPGALMNAHLKQPVKLPYHLPLSLRRILLRSLAKLSGQRYRSATEMLNEIRLLQEEVNALPYQDAQFRSLPLVGVKSWRDRYVALPDAILPPISSERIDQPIQALLIQPRLSQVDILYRVEAQAIRFGLFLAMDISRSQTSVHQFDAPIVATWETRSGCYVSTQNQLHYCDEEWRKVCLQDPPNAQWLAIDPMGNWFIRGAGHRDALEELYGYYPEQAKPQWQRSLTPPLPSNPNPISLRALDTKHFVVISLVESQSSLDPESNTPVPVLQLHLWTRRGELLGVFSLPGKPIRFWTLSQTYGQYQILATDETGELLLIQLKPLRIRRLILPIVPVLIVAVKTGYFILSSAGEGLVLDRNGEWLHRFQTAASPTAATVVQDRYLVIASWNDGQGVISTLDISAIVDQL